MIEKIFIYFTNALYGSPHIAVAASFVWGILSILLSPCHLSSIPLIVGFISGQGKTTAKKAFWISLSFSTGILISIAVIGIVTSLLGRMMGDLGRSSNYLVAGILIFIGVYLFDIIQITIPGFSGQDKIKKKGILAAFLLGLIFGLALGPCTFAYMAPMLAITLKLAADSFIYGVVLLLAYGIGHCSVIVVAGTFTELIQTYLNWNEKSKAVSIIKKICGGLLVAAGMKMLF